METNHFLLLLVEPFVVNDFWRNSVDWFNQFVLILFDVGLVVVIVWGRRRFLSMFVDIVLRSRGESHHLWSHLAPQSTVSKVLGNLKNDADVMSWSRLSSIVTTCLYSHWGSRSTDNISLHMSEPQLNEFPDSQRLSCHWRERTSLCYCQIVTDSNWLHNCHFV